MTKLPYEKPRVGYIGTLQGHTFHECATCDNTTGPGLEGYSCIIVSSGYTQHFCSGACIRAYVNGTPKEGPSIINIILTVGMVLAVAIALAL